MAVKVIDKIPVVPSDLEMFQTLVTLTKEEIDALQKGKYIEIEVGDIRVYLHMEVDSN